MDVQIGELRHMGTDIVEILDLQPRGVAVVAGSRYQGRYPVNKLGAALTDRELDELDGWNRENHDEDAGEDADEDAYRELCDGDGFDPGDSGILSGLLHDEARAAAALDAAPALPGAPVVNVAPPRRASSVVPTAGQGGQTTSPPIRHSGAPTTVTNPTSSRGATVNGGASATNDPSLPRRVTAEAGPPVQRGDPAIVSEVAPPAQRDDPGVVSEVAPPAQRDED